MPEKLSIAIIGFGMGGLSAAAYLFDAGFSVELFERFDEPKPIGAGLLLQPTGLVCLSALGLAESATNLGAKVHVLHGINDRGKTILELDYRDLQPKYFGLGIHRSTLFNLLLGAIQTRNIPIYKGKEIIRTPKAGLKRNLKAKDGSEFGPFDLVVDASGARSNLRQSELLKFNKPYPYGAVWGLFSDENQQFARDILSQRYRQANFMAGVLPIGKSHKDGNDQCAFFWSLPRGGFESWKANSFSNWQDTVVDLWPELRPFIDQFKSHDDLSFASYSDVVMRKWHSHALVYIGDAAHSTSPQLGQGANFAMMDGLILSQMLSRYSDINLALKSYTKARRSSIRFFQTASRLITPFFQSDCRHLAKMRDWLFGPMCKMPLVKYEMLKSLAGIKTGVFTSKDPYRMIESGKH